MHSIEPIFDENVYKKGSRVTVELVVRLEKCLKKVSNWQKCIFLCLFETFRLQKYLKA